MNPFASGPKERISDWGESRLIANIRDWLGPRVVPPPPRGMGDDCAVVPRPKGKCAGLVTVDPVVYQRHFSAACPAPRAGAKLVNRNLSDLAAMGGWPRWGVISLVLSDTVGKRFLRAFFKGIRTAALPWGLHVVGGDVSAAAGQEFIATLTLYGEARRPVCRGRTRAGMHLWVSGTLGGSALGHGNTFEPRLAQGRWLAEPARAATMIDLTDGLAKDLPALLAPGTAARIDTASLPVSAAARRLARKSGAHPLKHVFSDGEDYELLWATPAKVKPGDFARAWAREFPRLRLSHIGRVVKATPATPRIHDSRGHAFTFDSGTGFTHF